MKYFLVFVVATIMATCAGTIFNYVHVPTGGLNRYIYIFFVPIILYLVGTKQIKLKYFGLFLAGGSLGLFFSKMADITELNTLMKYGMAFLLVYCMYVFLLVELWNWRHGR